MGVIYTQPQYPAPIDWGNPITRGIISAQSGLGFDHVRGVGTYSDSTAFSHPVTAKGIGFNPASTNTLQFPTTPYPLSVISGVSGTFNDSLLYIGTSETADWGTGNVNHGLGFTANGSNHGFANSYNTSAVAGKLWNGIATVIGVSNAGPYGVSSVWVDGVQKTGLSRYSSPVSANVSKLTSESGQTGILSVRWIRPLNITEIASLTANPWQIFKAPTRKLWASVGGGTNTPVNPAVGSIAITGYAPTLAQTANQSIAPNVGNIAITGYAPSISQPIAINPAAGAISITGYAPVVAQTANQSISPSVGNITIAGYSPTISQPKSANPLAGTITITGYAPTVTQNVDFPVNPVAGTIAITGYAPTVSKTANQSVLPNVGNVAITGYSPTVAQSVNQAVLPAVGLVAITGYAPSISQPLAVNPAVGSITITGYAPTVVQNINVLINPNVGAIVIAGYAPVVSQTANQIALPASGNVAITGYAPTVSWTLTGVTLTADAVTQVATSGYAPLYYSMSADIDVHPAVRGTCHTRGG